VKTMDCGLITKKLRGPLCKNARKYGISTFLIYFAMEKSMDSVHASWTTVSGWYMVDPHGSADGEPPESGQDGALACHRAHRSSGSGGAVGVKWRQWWGSVRACSNVGEEERGAVSGAGCSRAEVPFYMGRGRVLGDDNGRHRRRNGRRREW
jgi:hypothetical protein